MLLKENKQLHELRKHRPTEKLVGLQPPDRHIQNINSELKLY